MCVVGRKLRVEGLPVGENPFRAGYVGNIGIRFSGKHGIACKALHLGVLDFRIPVGAFDQADGDPLTRFGRHAGQKFNHRQGPLLVCLQGQAQAVPTRQHRFLDDGTEHIQGQHQSIGFLGIHGQGHPVGHCQLRQLEKMGYQFT